VDRLTKPNVVVRESPWDQVELDSYEAKAAEDVVIVEFPDAFSARARYDSPQPIQPEQTTFDNG